MNNKQEMKITSQIIQELSLFLMHHGYKTYTLRFESHNHESLFIIEINTINQELLTYMTEKINRKREQEIEAYYWELLGEHDTSSDLDIMGLLIDEMKTITTNDTTQITLIRQHKEKSQSR